MNGWVNHINILVKVNLPNKHLLNIPLNPKSVQVHLKSTQSVMRLMFYVSEALF